MKRLTSIVLHSFLPLTAVCLLVGCQGKSSDLEKVVVEGTVTYEGEPIPNGEILFHPTEGTSGPVSGAPIADGAFVARGKGGVPVGKHRVEIRGYRPAGNAPRAAMAEGGSVEQYLPEQFNDRTRLTAEVDSSTERLDFNLSREN